MADYTFPKRTYPDDMLIIVKDGEEYRLPVTWAITDAGAYEFRNKLEEKVYAHGSDMVGDGKVDGRTIKIEFDIKGISEKAHDDILNQAYTYFSKTDYELYVGRGDRKYNVAGISKFAHEFRDGFKQRWSKVTVSLLLADPFRYEATESAVRKVFTEYSADGKITLFNEGSADTPLTFAISPSESAASVTITHEETGEKFTVADAQLTYPSVEVINGKEGTVWRNGQNNTINTFSGIFLHAEAGMNTFLYNGGAGTVEITYTNRWYV